MLTDDAPGIHIIKVETDLYHFSIFKFDTSETFLVYMKIHAHFHAFLQKCIFGCIFAL